METYFITRYKPTLIPCHESEPKCSNFRPGGCAWIPHEEKKSEKFCWRAHLLTKKIRTPSGGCRVRTPQDLSEDCPYFSNCNGELRYCDNAAFPPSPARLPSSCEKNIVQMPFYRFCIEELNKAEKEFFLAASGIEGHPNFRLASERELTTDPNNKDEHIKLLHEYNDLVRRDRRRPLTPMFPDGEMINHYEQAAKKAKEHVMLQSLATTKNDASNGTKIPEHTAPPLSTENVRSKKQLKSKKTRCSTQEVDEKIKSAFIEKHFNPDLKKNALEEKYSLRSGLLSTPRAEKLKEKAVASITKNLPQEATDAEKAYRYGQR